jgi:protein-S-isoprenylcysteine O-methyltransferase Ste14
MGCLLNWLLALLSFLAFLLLFVPWVLAALTPHVDDRLAFSTVFSLIVLEKICNMILGMKRKYLPEEEKNWTMVSVGYSFAIVLYLVIFEYYFLHKAGRGGAVALLGLLVYLAGVSVRYTAFASLKEQLRLHVNEGCGARFLVTGGIYGYIRHPVYLGACLEGVGIPLIFNSFYSLLFSVLVFLPFELHRAYVEEKYLRTIFGDEYEEYSSRTWGFLPLPFGKKSLS